MFVTKIGHLELKLLKVCGFLRDESDYLFFNEQHLCWLLKFVYKNVVDDGFFFFKPWYGGGAEHHVKKMVAIIKIKIISSK